MEHGAISLLTSEFHSLYIETSTLIKYHQFLESIITKMHVGGMRNLYKYMLNMIVWGVLEKKPHLSCKDGFNKGQQWYGPNRNRRC